MENSKINIDHIFDGEDGHFENGEDDDLSASIGRIKKLGLFLY